MGLGIASAWKLGQGSSRFLSPALTHLALFALALLAGQAHAVLALLARGFGDGFPFRSCASQSVVGVASWRCGSPAPGARAGSLPPVSRGPRRGVPDS